MLQLRGQELNSQRQPSRGQDLFGDKLQDLLGWHVGGQTLSQHTEEVSLLDILFTVKNRRGDHVVILPEKDEG